MKRLLICLSMVVTICHMASADEWLADLPAALSRAKSENKAVLLDFTGSDWCGWCMKLKKEVFDQSDFATYANANLILVEVDFPHHKQQSAVQKRANQALAEKFGIEGFPTIILLNSGGQQIGRSGYAPGGPVAFINDMDRSVRSALRYSVEAQKVAASANSSQSAAPAPPPPPVAAPPPDPTQNGELTLKGVSGVGDHRLALINHQTMMVGETGKVRTPTGSIEVTVKEIHDRGALIVVN
jgi:protein disulfide-isomerase